MRFFLFIFLMLSAYSAAASKSMSKAEKAELHCLASNVYFEARGEQRLGQLAVAMVTMNRVESRRFPNSICRVVWQKRQFSWTHDGKSDRPTDKKAWSRAKEVADFIFHKYTDYNAFSNGAQDLTQGALHYYAPKLAAPRWARSKEVTRQIGGHLFLAEKL